MRAAVIDNFGGPDVLRIAELAVPEPGAGEVLVRVRAAGVNAIDWATRAGQGVGVQRFPAVLGWDVAGTVVATGTGVAGLARGDEVFGMPWFPELAGGYAEYLVAPADQLALLPDGVDVLAAAGAGMVSLTAWQTVVEHARVSAGQRVLVCGAAGGVGHVAVQLAKLAGAEVIATASAVNHDYVTELGADRVIDYTAERVEDAVRDLDVVVDPRGGKEFDRLLGVLRPGGIIVTLKGQQPGQQEAVAARGVRTGYTYVGPNGSALDEIAKLLAAGQLRIGVERVLPLADVATAHTIGEGGHVRGRLVLTMES
jgi:NADPH:quinone reductase-like Zn-dependent oxidoreductase